MATSGSNSSSNDTEQSPPSVDTLEASTNDAEYAQVALQRATDSGVVQAQSGDDLTLIYDRQSGTVFLGTFYSNGACRVIQIS